ncbi:acetylornithine deacetylase [Marinivivus vitaminiproducens]|uniref:acetylornithine deacetylase n=1 Tax=Marinivivus vitaminiproducens TaxID=3035935 RepID=UPI0027A443D2|nr:acetylornithine deacetylase [Geminicoccaceae bacterium SCSIO 64248]
MSEASTLALLERLVAFDTVSRNSNLPLIEFVRSYLDGLGVTSRLVHDATGTKANLFATIGPADRPGVILSGHTDVVPVDGQAWDTDPFALTARDGRLYGRGSCDMKGFDAVILALVPEMMRAKLRRPIHLALSYDEEVGCQGVRTLITALEQDGLRPWACFVGEPTEMGVVIGHKGKRSLRATVTGRECHSSLAPRGVNAVEYAARLVVFISDIGRAFQESGARDALYDIPHTTAHAGVSHGGTVVNIVPNRAEVVFEFRHLPGDDIDDLVGRVRRFAADTLEPAMQEVAPETGIVFEEIATLPPLATEPEAPVVTLAKQLSRNNAHGKVAFGTEGGIFQSRLGVPTVVCGPGNIEQAHKPNEFIERSQLEACEGFVRRLIDHLASDQAA